MRWFLQDFLSLTWFWRTCGLDSGLWQHLDSCLLDPFCWRSGFYWTQFCPDHPLSGGLTDSRTQKTSWSALQTHQPSTAVLTAAVWCSAFWVNVSLSLVLVQKSCGSSRRNFANVISFMDRFFFFCQSGIWGLIWKKKPKLWTRLAEAS